MTNIADLPSLPELLTVQPLETTDLPTWVGLPSNEPHVRAFGGQVLGQAVAAVSKSVTEDRLINSFHAYFLRPGSPNLPIHYGVESIRDGRSFSNRRLDATQNGKTIFQLSASFHTQEAGIEHSATMPDVPLPEHLQSFADRFAGRQETDMQRWFIRARSLDIRYVDHSPFESPSEGHPAKQQIWFRFIDTLGDDPALHRAVLAYSSDLTVLDAILLAHGIRWTDRSILGASLDHAMWFHQPFRADEWLLFDQESPITFGGRGMARAQIWTQDGRLVCSVAQEALLRPPF